MTKKDLINRRESVSQKLDVADQISYNLSGKSAPEQLSVFPFLRIYMCIFKVQNSGLL